MPSGYKLQQHDGDTGQVNGSVQGSVNCGSFSMKSASKIPDYNGQVRNIAGDLRKAFGTETAAAATNGMNGTNGHHQTIQAFSFYDSTNGNGVKHHVTVTNEQHSHTSMGDCKEQNGVPHDTQIFSSKGTIRGVRNRVRAGIAAFINSNQPTSKNYPELEHGKIIVYTTSVQVVRDTFEKCKMVLTILHTHMVTYENRNVFMSKDYQKELAERLQTENPEVPQVFVNGIHLGDATQFQKMNESGELRHIFAPFPKQRMPYLCEQCGGYGYLPCHACHGSRKSMHRNSFTVEFSALRCTICDENGLVRCERCLSSTATKM